MNPFNHPFNHPFKHPFNLFSNTPSNAFQSASNTPSNDLATHPPYPPRRFWPFGRAKRHGEGRLNGTMKSAFSRRRLPSLTRLVPRSFSGPTQPSKSRGHFGCAVCR